MHFSVSVSERVSSHTLHIQLARWFYTPELLCRLSRFFCSCWTLCCKPDMQDERVRTLSILGNVDNRQRIVVTTDVL